MRDKLYYQYWGKADGEGNVEIPCLNHGLRDDTDLETSGQIVLSEKSVKSVQSPESVILKEERKSEQGMMEDVVEFPCQNHRFKGLKQGEDNEKR